MTLHKDHTVYVQQSNLEGPSPVLHLFLSPYHIPSSSQMTQYQLISQLLQEVLTSFPNLPNLPAKTKPIPKREHEIYKEIS